MGSGQTEEKYYRVEYDSRLMDGRPFRPDTFIVVNGYRSVEGAARGVQAAVQREAEVSLGLNCVVTIRKVEEVPERDYLEYSHLVMEDFDLGIGPKPPTQCEPTAQEAARRGLHRARTFVHPGRVKRMVRCIHSRNAAVNDHREVQTALTEAEVARLLGISTAALRAWRMRGTGPRFCRFGRSVRYFKPDLDQFISDSGLGVPAGCSRRSHRS